jgi:hypothetical protein
MPSTYLPRPGFKDKGVVNMKRLLPKIQLFLLIAAAAIMALGFVPQKTMAAD